jgi:hypothetical protein
MNFLWIIEVLAIIFLLKILFPIYLLNFKQLWIGPQLPKSAGASAKLNLRLREQGPWTAGWFLDFLGFLLQNAQAEGVSGFQDRPIRSGWPGLDPSHREPVRARDGWIKD